MEIIDCLTKMYYYIPMTVPTIPSLTTVRAFASTHKKLLSGVCIALVVIGIIARTILTREAPETPVEQSPRAVSVQSVAELSQGGALLSVVGTVESRTEATIRAEKSGVVTRVYGTLGAPISSGALLAELENASERAAVAQAQAAVAVAEASLLKVTGGTRSEQRAILETQLNTARTSLESARNNAVNTLVSTYASIDNAILGTADTLFSNPRIQPQFSIVSSNSQYEIDAENKRVALATILSRQEAAAAHIQATDNLEEELARTEAELREVRSFFDTIIQALNTAVPTAGNTSASIATHLSTMTATRSGISTSLATLSATREGLQGKEAAVTIAEKSLEQGVTGGQPEDVAAAEASVSQARAGLSAAYAQLQKSMIRTPISGTINAFSLKRGDFVQAFTPVATVANNGTLEITTYITENDAPFVTKGIDVRIQGGAEGIVTTVAPALDPLTKKIEVKIQVTRGELPTNGSTVLVSFDRTEDTADTPQRISIPLTALKVGTDAMRVFTLTPEHVVVGHVVEIGSLLGDRVEIQSGLTPEMEILVDARGIREGQTVSVK